MRMTSNSGSRRRRRYNERQNKKRGCVLPWIAAVIFLIILSVFLFRGCTKYIGDKLDSMSDSLTKQQYPIKYKSQVEKYSKKYGLDKYLVYAVIRTESKFDQYAVSNAGAYGLMQLQEETASDCARKLELDITLPDDLYDPDINIHLGTYYLSWLLDRYNDDLSLAIAAYNGGIGNVDAWLEDERYSDGSGGLTDIPYAETKSYVTGVTASYEKYKEIY